MKNNLRAKEHKRNKMQYTKHNNNNHYGELFRFWYSYFKGSYTNKTELYFVCSKDSYVITTET